MKTVLSVYTLLVYTICLSLSKLFTDPREPFSWNPRDLKTRLILFFSFLFCYIKENCTWSDSWAASILRDPEMQKKMGYRDNLNTTNYFSLKKVFETLFS